MGIEEVFEGFLEDFETAPEPISQDCPDKSYFEAMSRFFLTCDEYMSINTWRNITAISIYALKGIQLIQFTCLFCVLLISSIKKKGSIGYLPIIISFVAISNAVFMVNQTIISNSDHGYIEKSKTKAIFTFI